LSSRHRLRNYSPVFPDRGAANIAAAYAAYNEAGGDYAAYADGDPTRLYDFDGLHGYADRQVWALLEAKLSALRATGSRSISILDAGCGPGTWLRRLVTRAYTLGFTSITARGFDIAKAQIQRAQLLARDLEKLSGVDLTFEVAHLAGRLPEAGGSVDITLCLYSVLSHLPVESLPNISSEIARVTSVHFITTVRAAGSTPTILIDSIKKARHFSHDNSRDKYEIALYDGRHMIFDFHLFTAAELQNYFADDFEVEDLRGLDLFHNRFAPDSRWNPASLTADVQFCNELERLEENLCQKIRFHGTGDPFPAGGAPPRNRDLEMSWK